jgi:hypothetical protein
MAASLKEIAFMLEKIIEFEGKVEEAIKSEKDKSKRKKLAKAFKDRDPDALRKLLFDL